MERKNNSYMGNVERNASSARGNIHHEEDEDLDSSNRRTLWIGGGITHQVDEEMLFEMFNNAGPVEDVRIPMDRERNQAKNFAFVTFHHEESLSYAMALFDRVRLFGKELILKPAGYGNSNRSNERHHSRSISAPGTNYQKKNHHSSPYNNQQPSRTRGNDSYSSRFQPQYNNYQNQNYYQDSYSSGRDGYDSHHHYSRNSSHNDRRDRRYDRRSYEYDRYRH